MVRCSGGEGGGGGGGVMTSMRMRLAFSFCFVDLLLLCGGSGGERGEGGGVMTSTRMRLVFSFCFVDLLLIVLVVISGYLLLGFPHVDHAKTSRFFFESDAKIELKKHEKHGICDTFAKTLPKNKNEEHWKTKTPTHRVVDENLAKYRVFLISTKKTSQK